MNLGPSGYEPDELPDCSTPLRSGYFAWRSGPDDEDGAEPVALLG